MKSELKREKKERLRQLVDAAKSVVERRNPVTFGLCYFCEHPVTTCYLHNDYHTITVCEMCLPRVTTWDMYRMFEDDMPAMTI